MNQLKKILYHRTTQWCLRKLSPILRHIGFIPKGKWYYRWPVPHVVCMELLPRQQVCFKNQGYALEKSIFWKGKQGYEPGTLEVVVRLAGLCNWLIDVGANSGFFSMAAACAHKGLIVHAFEPMPAFCALIQQNATLNAVSVQVHGVALSNAAGLLDFYIPRAGQGNIYSATLSRAHFAAHQDTEPLVLQVPVAVFDKYMAGHTWQGSGLVKIDAEGYDYEVLDGMQILLSEKRPYLIVENWSGATAQKMVQLPGLANYVYFAIREALPELHSIVSPNHNYGSNTLCCPREKVAQFQSVFAGAIVHSKPFYG